MFLVNGRFHCTLLENNKIDLVVMLRESSKTDLKQTARFDKHCIVVYRVSQVVLSDCRKGYYTTTGNMEPESKKTKLEGNGHQEVVRDLSEFEFVRVLADYSQKKVVCVEGRLKGKEGKAVLWLDKLPLSEEVIKAMCTEKSQLVPEFNNDIYGSYSALVDPKLNEIKTTLVYPATEQHIQRFLQKPVYIVEETPECYKTITLPFIEKEQLSVEWVYNILEGKKETDRIIYEDKDPDAGFTLIPDLKWNAKQTVDLYCLALVRPRGIKSLRDLTGKHVSLLKNVLDKGREVIEEKFKIGKERLRVYIHYQPTFYHLHVHFNVISFEASGSHCEKAYLLRSVIDNLERYPDYYKNATLTCVVSEGQNLCQEFISKGVIRKLETPNKDD
ncbi:hypothetical protein GE061_001831 [Apolygus lucorum]|uniref:m7GpppX diphosphatase n=1 Tax=Apolygus lucorum TaxID=248454 RepID=A0A8S9X2X8_APOLU|nr:hypothetical protein GE061_001831 [Apolygus lucorum]